MMSNHNMNHIKAENRKNTRHLHFRKMTFPKTNMDKRVNRPFQHEFTNGTFRNDIYYSMDPSVILWTYIRNILLFCIPAFMLHGVMWIIDSISKAVLGNEYATPASGIQLLFIVYGICLFFAFRKISDNMAYYNVSMLVSKYNINQTTLRSIHRNMQHVQNMDADRELAVLEHYRQKFNKYSLFPSVKELAVEEQMYRKEKASRHDAVKQHAELRRDRLSLYNKRAEHIAAKEIADWKQKTYGGVNEYDTLVKKYKNRTIPAVQDIIDDILTY